MSMLGTCTFTYKAHIKLLHKFFFLTGKHAEASLEMLYSHPYFLKFVCVLSMQILKTLQKM